jgi:hypothetical protein
MLRFQFPVPRLLASGAGTLIRATRTCSGFVYLALSDLCPYNSDRDTRLHATGYYCESTSDDSGLSFGYFWLGKFPYANA